MGQRIERETAGVEAPPRWADECRGQRIETARGGVQWPDGTKIGGGMSCSIANPIYGAIGELTHKAADLGMLREWFVSRGRAIGTASGTRDSQAASKSGD